MHTRITAAPIFVHVDLLRLYLADDQSRCCLAMAQLITGSYRLTQTRCIVPKFGAQSESVGPTMENAERFFQKNNRILAIRLRRTGL